MFGAIASFLGSASAEKAAQDQAELQRELFRRRYAFRDTNPTARSDEGPIITLECSEYRVIKDR